MLAPAIALAGILAACDGDNDRELSKVFVAPPWTGEESYLYRLSRVEDDEPYGECTLETKPRAEDSNTRLNLLCTDGVHRDDGTALVEPTTLRPLSSNRTRVDPEEDLRLSFTASYVPPLVKFQSDENGKTRQTERELPVPDETSTEPGYYDDVSLLWLMRGLAFAEGYEASFQNVAPGQGQTFPVDLKVERQERVAVPAGEFNTWRVRLRTSSLTNLYWIEVDAPHRVIKARVPGIQDVEYELTKSE